MKPLFSSLHASALVALTLGTVHLASFAATSGDAAVNFSSSQTGDWSYGTSTSLFGSVTTFEYYGSVNATTGSMTGWRDSVGSVPWAGIALAGSSGYSGYGTIRADPNTLWAHPDANRYVVLQFTAPTTSSYVVSASFWGDDTVRGTSGSTDVHVASLTGTGVTSLFNSSVAANYAGTSGGLTSFAPSTVSLSAGDKLYFVVGAGTDTGGTRHYFDSTGLQASVAAVPEPGEWAMMLAGLSLVGFVARRRKQA